MKQKIEDRQVAELRNELSMLAQAMNNNYDEYNSVDDSDLIEALIYERCSLEARYKYLIGKAKKMGLNVDF